LLMLLLCISKSRNECALRIDVYTLIVCLLNVKIPQYTIIPEKYLFDGLLIFIFFIIFYLQDVAKSRTLTRKVHII